MKPSKFEIGSAGSLRRALIRGGVGSTFIMVGSMLLGFFSTAILARLLGPTSYGAYSYAIVLVGLVAIPMHPGISQLVVRETALALAESDWGVFRGLWQWATKMTLGWSFLISLISTSVFWAFMRSNELVDVWTFSFGLVLMPIIVLTAIFGAAVRGLGHIVLGLLSEQVLRNGFLILILISVYYGSSTIQWNASVAMTLTVVASFLALLIGVSILILVRPAAIGQAGAIASKVPEWTAAVWPLALVASMQLVNHHADLLMLGLFKTAKDVGIYKVVISGATLVVFGLQAVNMVVAPHFSRLHALGDHQQLQRVVTASSIGALLLSMPVAFTFLFLGGPILQIIFGVEYVDGYAPLAILSCGQLANSLFGPVGYLLNMTGYERETARGVSIAAGCNVCLNLLLIPRYGMIGAAFATATTLLIWNVLLWRSARQLLDINTIAISLNGLRGLFTERRMR
jgi:O-antigen/teichoic acid export membrane protein